MEKETIESCLSQYSTKELIQFHANLNAIFLCCNTDFKLLPLLMNIHFAIAARKGKLANDYLIAVTTIMSN